MQGLDDSKNLKIEFSSDALDFFADRRAATHAKFLLPFINSGLRLLDCGCGPGTITLDLAELVSPGKVIGIDISPAQIEVAKSLQIQRKLRNIRFELGDVNKLKFPSESFDIVFAHGVIEYLEDPIHAFKELHRVLSKDGILAVRHADWGGFLLAPENDDVELFFDLFRQLMVHDGGNLSFGRNQISYLRKAGFNKVQVSASYDCWTPSPDITQKVAVYMASHCLSNEFMKPVLELKLADKSTLEKISEAFLEWGKNPDAFAAEAWAEAIAFK